MKATPFSKEHYYPMCLANGRDCVLVNYDGSNFVSLNPHTHNVPYEASPCGWYKTANLKKGEYLYPVVMAGIQIVQYSAPAEPMFYEQEFFPEKAELITNLDFRYGLKLRITSFITKDSIWCERAEVLDIPEDAECDLAFRVNEPFFAHGCYHGDIVYNSEFEFSTPKENELFFDYRVGNFGGKGVLIANAPFDKTVERTEKEPNNLKNIEGYFKNIRKGDVFERVMICLGENETHITFEELYKKASMGVSELESEHLREWQEYFSVSDVTLPDEKLNYIYNVSRYIIKSYQHPETGLIALGLLPNHWKGGVWCSWDAEFAHEALLSSGNFKESAFYTDSYIKLSPEGYEVLEKNGYPGVAFAGWNTVNGEFIGHTSLEEWLINFKPLFCANAIRAIYNEWQHNRDAVTSKHIKIAEDILAFWLAKMVTEKNGLYYIINIKDSAETENDVPLDSWVQSEIAKCFHFVAEMSGVEKYQDIGDKMFEALEDNRRPDGVIADYTGSPYSSFLIWQYRNLSEENLITVEALEELFRSVKTPWGYDTNIAIEEYRHWPWYNSGAAITFTIAKRPELAMENLKAVSYGVSSLGALPEKIRLDGFAVNHWYISPHSILVSAINAAFAHSVKRDEILLGYGFTADYGDFDCRDLWVRGRYSVSLKVKNGEIVYLEIKNDNPEDKDIVLDINPEFEIPDKLKNIRIKAKSSFCFKG